VFGLHDVGDPALAGLGVHPDDCLVRAADIEGINRQVRGLPGNLPDADPLRIRPLLQVLQTLLDRVLVAS
jgi:hypothetical protein